MICTKNNIADDILSRYWDGIIPVDVNSLAKSMNIEIVFHDDADKPLIQSKIRNVYRSTISIYKKPTDIQNRFAVALGIAQIAHNIRYKNIHGWYAWTELARNDTSSNTTNALDSVHNDIAIELLVPLETLKYVIIADSDNVEQLAKRFDVSEVLMYNAVKKIL